MNAPKGHAHALRARQLLEAVCKEIDAARKEGLIIEFAIGMNAQGEQTLVKYDVYGKITLEGKSYDA